MGASIFPISGYGGSQYDISILVWKVTTKAHMQMQINRHFYSNREQRFLQHLFLSPVVVLNSPTNVIRIFLEQDPKEGNWWMQFGNDYVLGYWPSFLFSYLADSATMIEWGGEVVNTEADGEHTATQMGSGRFPEEGFGKASYFRNIQIVDGSNNLRAPKGVGTFTEQSNCYDVQNGNNGDWGSYFYYGGPGKNPNCP